MRSLAAAVAVVVAVVFVAVTAQDYYYDAEMCTNIHPGLWVRDPFDCMVAHQCGFDSQISQSVKCNASQVWSKLASSCVWEWDPDRDDCNGSPAIHIASKQQPRFRMQGPVPKAGQNHFGSNPFGSNPMGANPMGINPQGANPMGMQPNGQNPGGRFEQYDPRCVKQTGNNPDPDDCSRFISCSNGTMIAVQRCGDGTLYWPRNNTCEFAQVVVHECGTRRIPETIIIREDDPLCRDNGQVPDPISCRHFIQCQNGRRTQRIQCPHGTSFSDKTRKCEWHSEVRCANREGSPPAH